MDEIAEFLRDASTEVDVTLDELLPASDVQPERLHEAIRWSVFAGGKRIRPGVLYAVGRTFDADRRMLARTAAATEMIHTFSLIHDDLPAMDDDDLRRGRVTCHKKYGEATAILAGDALQTLAFQTIAEDTLLPPDLRVKLICDFARASATPAGMVAGQQLDLEAEGREVSLDELENIHACKTGALITASAVAGALIGGATDGELSNVRNYASRLGLLFQITDDLLDVTQATETLGKTAGKDVFAEKATYPANLGIEGTRAMMVRVRHEAVAALEGIERDTWLLISLTDLIAQRTN
jgi:geranylgeranyl pyrophosphate synthase